ncbi:MAG TPA: DUF3365 domain-containing protein [Polyangiaceae bacterium]|nr:DUF3365 domain-containing protein [Polyangiaceae bacterium]
MAIKWLIALALVSTLAGVYLFVNAPALLPEASTQEGTSMSAREIMEICAAENAAVRELYTKEIVGAGRKSGLKFDEKWRDAKVDAGPLPALFLRETAKSLAKSSVGLGLFLGSDFPISAANRFSGAQADAFQQMRRDRESRYFFMDDLKLHTAMFPDLAVAPVCVDCHNQHPESPKHDWKMGDVMGATTWTLPTSSMPLPDALAAIAVLRKGFRDAYVAYIEKAKTFSSPPQIGSKWPTDGYCLPSPDSFMEEAERRASKETLGRLISRR